MPDKTRYVLIGTGGRAAMYIKALVMDYHMVGELVGICDINAGRTRFYADRAKQHGMEIATFLAYDFDKMIAECRPDTVIVTSKDCTHDDYICRAMELGCDVITEKPMTMNEEKCQRILDTRKITGRKCRVTFNYRYAPPATQLKDLLMSGVIGEVRSIDFHWLLNTTHGADYFRRWHRQKANSGGLQVHKATHHFDLINWWLSSVPVEVYALGGLNFYTPHTANRMGLKNRAERCLDCPEANNCPFYFDLRAYPDLVDLYLDNEPYDGYHRDHCVFSQDIDIVDTLHAIVNYKNGVQMSYSLHAFMPWEGYIIAINGSRGRLEHTTRETTYINGDGTVPGELISEATKTRIIPHFQTGYDEPIWKGEGGHGGGDPRLLDDLFNPKPKPDLYMRSADERAGAYSILTGIAASRSMEWHRPVQIDQLVSGLEDPDYPAMPTEDELIDPQSFMAGKPRAASLG
jgi:predicted dehydrogenase